MHANPSRWSSELYPDNRRIYDKAKAPFILAFKLVGAPYLVALPIAMVAALLICLLPGTELSWLQFVMQVGMVGLTFTVYLGAFLSLIVVLGAIINWLR